MTAQCSKVFKPIMLALAVSGLMYGLPVQQQAWANDLDIYRPAVEGKTTLVLMLDTSGSMGGSGACDMPSGVTSLSTGTVSSGTTPSYTRFFCNGSNGQQYFDRLTRLKDAMFALMDDPTVDSKIVMGLAQFSTQSNSSNTAISADGRSGKIVVVAAPLGVVGSAHRTAIKTAVARFTASSFTPTANAYAEAAAYLMGTTTMNADTVPVSRVVYVQNGTRNEYKNCNANNVPATSSLVGGSLLQTCSSQAANWSSTIPVAGVTTFYTQSGQRFYYRTENYPTNNFSGFSNSVTASKSTSNYIKPLPATVTECDGQGIYFLTDGEPNSAPAPLPLMRTALGNSAFSATGGLPNGTQADHGMPAVGAFAKFLFDKTKNPVQAEIKTAVVGYGKVFEGITKTTRKDPKTNKDRDYYNCNLATNQDAKNACNWGEKAHPNVAGVGGFGQGGFYYASSPADVVASVKGFLAELKNDIPAVPAGAVVVPQDTLAPDSLSPYAYLPLLQPEPGKSVVAWAGNLKKYDVREGTVFGGNSKLVFDNKGQFAIDTYDLWAVAKDAEGNKILDGGLVTAGGAYANLPMPTKTNSLDRNVWLQNGSTTSTPSTDLRRVRPTITDMNSLPDLTNLQRRYLLNFLGYDIPEVATPLVPSSLLDPANILPTTLVRPDKAQPIMGGVVHSTPQMLTYSADLKEDGSLSDQRDESLLFGSFEGALHIINADTGVEQMAFIPREILDKQPRALKPNTTGSMLATSQVAPTPTAFGVDAPWAAYAEYARTGGKIKATSMYAYGGLRLGGNSFYGLDIIARTAPKIMFTLTPTKTGFARLGQAWGKPVITRVRYNDKIRTVVIVSGGYDVDYEKMDKDRSATTAVQGNAVYMLDAKTGELLLSIGRNATETPSVAGSATLLNANIRYSVVSRVKTLDRDADGLTDHLYFADLGGQLFRVDLQNAPATTKEKFGQRVVRLADLTTAHGAGKPGPRFYEAPIVTIHDEGSRRFAVVNIGSGDRSNPLDITSTTATNPNRIYGVIDRDVARQDLYSNNITMRSENIQLNDAGSAKGLIEKPSTPAHKAAMLSDGADRKNGWHYPINEYGQNMNLPGLKSFNEGVAIRNDLYMSVYNPSVVNNGANPCSAQVLGGTELHRYCLPFGICAATDPIQRFNLGQGIQSAIVGPDDTDGQTRRLVYQRKTTDVEDEITGESLNQHRKYPTPPRLVPLRWFEKQPKLPPQ